MRIPLAPETSRGHFPTPFTGLRFSALSGVVMATVLSIKGKFDSSFGFSGEKSTGATARDARQEREIQAANDYQ